MFYGVFRIDPTGHLHLATDECEYPNGLAFSPDESVLYVAISRLDERCFEEAERGKVCQHRLICAFDVAPDGTLSNNRVFCNMSSADPGVPDGNKVDTVGRVFCVGSGGIWVIAPSGEVIGIFKIPEVVRNLAFGGPDFRTLYLTTRGALAKLEVKTPGIGAFRLAGNRVASYAVILCSPHGLRAETGCQRKRTMPLGLSLSEPSDGEQIKSFQRLHRPNRARPNRNFHQTPCA